MVLALTLLAASSKLALNPIDDVWVYPHATDQREPYLRFWGSNGESVPLDGSETSISWSVLKFDLAKLPGGKLEKATLTVWLIPGSTLSQADVDEHPIEVRAVSPGFEEESFAFGEAKLVLPSPESTDLFGKGSPQIFDNADKPQKAEINLLVKDSTFAKYLEKAGQTRQKELGLALTSTIDPSTAGEGLIYKIFSTNAEDKALRPRLDLTFSD